MTHPKIDTASVPGKVWTAPQVFFAILLLWSFLGNVTYPEDRVPYRLSDSLLNPAPVVFGGFGTAIAATPQRILVGAPHGSKSGEEKGEVYLYESRSRKVLQTYSSPHSVGDDLFGLSVGFFEGQIMVGAPRGLDLQGSRTGAVYLFDGQTGSLLRTLRNPMPMTGVFGQALASHGSLILVGDPLASTPKTFHTGAAFLFDGKTGDLLRTFFPPDPKSGEADRFGHRVAFVDSDVLISAPLGGIESVDSGIAYLFDGRTGKLIRSFCSPKPHPHEYFGWSFAVQGESILIGSVGYGKENPEEGVAYLFDATTGRLVLTIRHPEPVKGDHFGEAVAMFDDLRVIGAPGNDVGGIDAGAVYLMEATTGGLQQTVVNPMPETGAADLFGLTIVGVGTKLLVGAPYGGTETEPDSGVVHQFVPGKGFVSEAAKFELLPNK